MGGEINMGRIFTGDFSTGTFEQWKILNNAGRLWGGSGPYGPAWPRVNEDHHYVRIVPLGDSAGHAARFECRNGDISPSGGERTEIAADELAKAEFGTTRWYAWSVKFGDEEGNFPLIGDTGVSWLSATQFSYTPVHLLSPCIQFGYGTAGDPGVAAQRAGYWYLIHAPAATNPAGGWTYTGNSLLFEMPLAVGEWHDIKMQATWARDNTGMIRLWRNGVRQTLMSGGETFTGQTAQPDGGSPGQTMDGVTISHGIYRRNPTTPTMVVTFSNWRMADSESAL